MTASGHMQIYRDGVRQAELRTGWAPEHADRNQLLISRCASRRELFSGRILDLRVWNAAVLWDELPQAHVGAVVSVPEKGAPLALNAERGKKFRKAAGEGQVSVLDQMLAESPSLLHETDRGGKGALHYAARAGAAKAVRRLLAWNADANLADGDGIQPLDEAEWWYVKESKDPAWAE